MSTENTVDYLVIGSGAAGLSAALHAHELGMEVLTVEASDQYGGSSAISGGMVWIPDNPQLPSRGIPDSRDDSIGYLTKITGGTVSAERIAAYVDHSVRMLAWMRAKTHLHLDALEEYCDYYPEEPGGKPGGRSMEPMPFDATKLGDQFALLRPPHLQSQVLGKFGITAREVKGFLAPTWAGRFRVLWRIIQYLARFWKRRGQPRDTKLHAGNALIARLRRSMMDRDLPLWLNSPAKELVIEDGRVVGAIVERNGAPIVVRSRFGVLLAAGGFEHNQAMRDEHHSLGPSSTEWNTGNKHNTGAGIVMGQAAGGAVDLMHEAWWTPITRIPKSDVPFVLVVEKSLPGSLMVNEHGARFTNEAAPYIDVVKGMYAGDAVPVCWLIFDATYRKRYPVGPVAPGYAQPDHRISRRLRDGFFTRGKTLEELAEKLELDPAALKATIERYNGFAKTGVDEDYGRGSSLAGRYYADPLVAQPNPCLRALTDAPFYAIPVFPGELGTKGGLVTDAGARVLREDGSPIPGLFAAGNTSASMMGPTYPGAGGTIGPALTFGFISAETAAADGVVESAPEAASA